ncbi:MAG: hypothetical protein N0A16_04985 [Blastocatellia bacterium]|nr:hypothetical protein [Blastocatellia bacterium]MCX7752268.1 hypothetical protein [Blastocatellia bacterium]MDW8167760.1 hypothetical protein [Acidobacteriota bacterium]
MRDLERHWRDKPSEPIVNVGVISARLCDRTCVLEARIVWTPSKHGLGD